MRKNDKIKLIGERKNTKTNLNRTDEKNALQEWKVKISLKILKIL